MVLIIYPIKLNQGKEINGCVYTNGMNFLTKCGFGHVKRFEQLVFILLKVKKRVQECSWYHSQNPSV